MNAVQIQQVVTDALCDDSLDVYNSSLISIFKTFVQKEGLCIIVFEIENNIPIIKDIKGDITSITGYEKEEMLNEPLIRFIQLSKNSKLQKSIELLEDDFVIPKFQTAIRKDGSLLKTFGFIKKNKNVYVEYMWSVNTMM